MADKWLESKQNQSEKKTDESGSLHQCDRILSKRGIQGTVIPLTSSDDLAAVSGREKSRQFSSLFTTTLSVSRERAQSSVRVE